MFISEYGYISARFIKVFFIWFNKKSLLMLWTDSKYLKNLQKNKKVIPWK